MIKGQLFALFNYGGSRGGSYRGIGYCSAGFTGILKPATWTKSAN